MEANQLSRSVSINMQCQLVNHQKVDEQQNVSLGKGETQLPQNDDGETLKTQDEDQETTGSTRKFMFLHLKTQIQPFHIICYLLLVFNVFLVIQFIIQFLVYILQSPKYYDVPKSDVGTVAGDAGAIAEIFVIIEALFLGLIFDTVGRKVPTVIGLTCVGLSIIALPYLSPSITAFICMRVIMSLGIIPGVNTPLMPDYVQAKSLGLANAYQSVVAASAVIFGSTVLIQVSRHVDLLYIFLCIGGFTLLVAFTLIFGIKDVISNKKPLTSHAVTKHSFTYKIRTTIASLVTSIKEQPGLSLAIVGSFTCKSASLIITLFGSLVIQANFEREDPHDYEDRAKALTSWIFLVGNVVKVPLSLYLGYLSDKVRVWIIVSVIASLSFISQGAMLMNIDSNSDLFVVSFTAQYTFNFTQYMLCLSSLRLLRLHRCLTSKRARLHAL
ncbi:hypothetical protein FGO68_gene10211 [Halteria grandinella]|uniref:Uncharacterized protein n=1 Tax=Halteria grandinella TaxID=5974 RepID=A0A8J8NED6_HALGN|nr:hypothetical protein FGO68_gene10211 [Halteria grandinella]